MAAERRSGPITQADFASLFPHLTAEEAQAKLDGIDQHAIHAEEKAKLVAEVWDKKSPINSVSAEVMLARFDVDRNFEVYLLRDAASGAVVLFQPHTPHDAGHVRMTPTTVQGHMTAHHDEIAWSRARGRIAAQVGMPPRGFRREQREAAREAAAGGR